MYPRKKITARRFVVSRSIKRRQPMIQTCNTCEYCKRDTLWWIWRLLGENFDKCRHSKAKFAHPVTGVLMQRYCVVERGEYGCCRESGDNWKSKETK
jgi:hypothetical protein